METCQSESPRGRVWKPVIKTPCRSVSPLSSEDIIHLIMSASPLLVWT